MPNGLGTPLDGDRSAWDSVNFPLKHAKDVADGDPTIHVPSPGASGNVVVSDGSVWTQIPFDLNLLSDVESTAPVEDDVLKFNGTVWIPSRVDWTEITSVPDFGGAYYFHDDVSEVDAAYEQLLSTPAGGTEDSDYADVVDSGGEVLIDKYLTEQELGQELIPGGLWQFNFYAKVDNSSGVSQIVVRIYTYDEGANETELFNDVTVDLPTTTGLVTINTVRPGYAVNTTDRLSVHIYGKTTSNSTKRITFYYEGTERYSHFHAPFSLVIVGGSGSGIGDMLYLWSNFH